MSMVLLILLLSYLHCYDSSSPTSDSTNEEEIEKTQRISKSNILSRKEYIKRVYEAIPKDKKGNILLTYKNLEVAKCIFEDMLDKIYYHYEGHRFKLAAFTSVLLNNYKYMIDFILTCDYFEKIRKTRGALQFSRKERMKILNVNYIKTSKFTFEERDQAIKTLKNEFKFFDGAIKKDFSFCNVVDVFFPHFYESKYDEKGKNLEYIYYTIVYDSKEPIPKNIEILFLNSDIDGFSEDEPMNN